MKSLRKMMALVFAMVMLVAMSVSTFAASITLTTQEGHTYEIYQIFTGEVDQDGKTLTQVKYGQNAETGTPGEFVSDTDLAELATLAEGVYANDQATIDAYEKFVKWSSTPIKTVDKGTTATDLAPGWYVIRDKNNKVPDAKKDSDGVTLYMFQVLNSNLEVSAKSGTVESEKKVQDINDTTDTAVGALQDAADYEIGDTIPYTLTFKLPANYADFEKYYVQFSDTMSGGLTYNGDAKIYYGASDNTGTSIDFGTAGAAGTETNLKYEIEDLKTEKPGLSGEDIITIKYTAYLNDEAVYGSAGNPNTYTVKFNNNPNDSGKGKPTGDTPEDKNIVFTYKTIFDKIDENERALEGADFKLEKWVEEKKDWVDVTELGDSAHPSKVGDSASHSTTFEFKGLDDGEYRLTETYTPAGYNTIDPIVFTITADHDETGDDPALRDLQATGLTMTKDVAAGSLRTSIENKSGAVLPSTGGIGTTIFYVVGAVLVLGAAVLLVAKRRVER